MNGVGYTADEPLQLFLVELPGLGEEPKVARAGRALKARNAATSAEAGSTPASLLPTAKQLTWAPKDHSGASFSTDGHTVYFTAALHEGADADLAGGIYAVAVGGGEPQAVVPANSGRQTVAAVRQSLDGKWLFFLAQDLGGSGQDFVAKNTALYVMPAGGGTPRG